MVDNTKMEDDNTKITEEITIIINCANFQPRVMTLPKSDFPIEMYKLLYDNSHPDPNDSNRRVLIQKVICNNGNIGSYEENTWTSVVNFIFNIIDLWDDPYYDPVHNDPTSNKDNNCAWYKNATVNRDHGYFNSKLITSAKINKNDMPNESKNNITNEIFEVIEQDMTEEITNDETAIKPMPFNTVDDFLDWGTF